MVALASLSVAASFRPRFSMVSIMPGMEKAAPDLTEKRRGLSPWPNFLPVFDSTSLILDLTRSNSPSGIFLPLP